MGEFMISLKTLAIVSFSLSLFSVSEIQAGQITTQDTQAVNEFDPVYGVPAKRKITIDYHDNLPLKRPEKKDVENLIRNFKSNDVTCSFINYNGNTYCTNQVTSFKKSLGNKFINLKIE